MNTDLFETCAADLPSNDAPVVGDARRSADAAASAGFADARNGGPPVPAPELDARPVTIIEPRPGWKVVDFAEMWRFRELLWFLVWRDVKVRYKQTFLGATWAVLQPFAQMVVFSVFFGKMASLPTAHLPYPLFAFAGLLPWIFFSNSITSAAASVVGNQNLVTKVYFPRLFVPASAIGVALVDFTIALGMLGVLMWYYGVPPTAAFLLTPVMIVGLTTAAFGIGAVPGRPHGRVSRLSLRGSVPRPTLDVRDSHRFYGRDLGGPAVAAHPAAQSRVRLYPEFPQRRPGQSARRLRAGRLHGRERHPRPVRLPVLPSRRIFVRGYRLGPTHSKTSCLPPAYASNI